MLENSPDRNQVESHERTIVGRDKSLNNTLPPSDPNFERAKVSDDEFIKLLLSENKELRLSLKSKEIMITNLLMQLNHLNDSTTNDSTGDESSYHMRVPNDDVPQRSARRKLSKKGQDESVSSADSDSRRESIASITSNGPIAAIDGIPLSNTFRTELSAALGSATSHDISASTSSRVTHVPGNDLTPRSLVSDGSTSKSPTHAYAISDELHGNSTNMFNSGVAENETSSKGRNTSVNSYKSRMQLPPALKQPESSNPSTPLIIQKSPDITNQPFGKYTPDSMNESELKLPHTPDGLAQGNFGKFAARTENSGQLWEDSQIFFESPFTNSPPNSCVTPTTNSNIELLKTPKAQTFQSTDSFHSYQRPSSQTPGSSFNVLSTPNQEEEDVELLIKPEEFQSIRIHAVSTIFANTRKIEDPNCTFSINDKESGKEMWRIRKTFSQLQIFDAEIRPVVECFGLPLLPDKSLFGSTTPLKVDSRRTSLQNYFNTLFVMPHVPRLVLFRVCRFLSLDFVNLLDDFRTGAKKEGFLIRRYKGLGLGTTWKVRWCQVDGPELEIYDLPGGTLLEQIKLLGSQIGRQSSDSVAEQRGYRHAFLILENVRSSKLSNSLPKHFFCAESDNERDEWVAAMVEYTENDPLAGNEDQNSLPEMDSPQLILQDEFDQSSTYFSGANMKGRMSLETDPGLTIFDESQRELKRTTKKKSRFTFRNRISTHIESQANKQEGQAELGLQQTEIPMQTYLDQMKLSDEPARMIFGRDIEEALRLSNHAFNGREVPSICYRCLDYLNRTGAVYEEGIFRLSGSASSIRQLKDRFNSVYDVDLFDSPLRPDIHTVAGLLKTYLRELPNSVFGGRSYSDLQSLVSQAGGSPNAANICMMRDFVRDSRKVSKVNYDFCVTIFGFLRTVISKSSTNKMNLKNVCIVFVPTLNISVDILSACLTDYDCIFGNADPIPDEKRQVLELQIPTF